MGNAPGGGLARGERIGLYPGTFDPVTLGHLDIIKRGLKLVDRLVVGVATNPSKSPLFSLEERRQMVMREAAPYAAAAGAELTVADFNELLMSFAEKVGASVIIRGLRAVSDFEYEFQMAGMNSHLNPDIDIAFLMADAKYQPIASKLVKEIAFLGGDISGFVTPRVAADIKQKVAELAGEHA